MSDRDYTVVGGSHGVEADLDDMDAAGGLIRSKGWNVGETALATHKYVLDANLLSSAVLAPATFATFESGLLGALDGHAQGAEHQPGIAGEDRGQQPDHERRTQRPQGAISGTWSRSWALARRA